MGDKSTIEWTDATWNPITGCSVVSAGCTNCYAMRLAGGRLRKHPSRVDLTRITGGKSVWTGNVRFNSQWLDAPLRWKRPRMIFVCAHGDLFHENVPDEWIDRVFGVMALAPQHTFQVLTKRPERMRDYLLNAKREIVVGLNSAKILDRPFHETARADWPLPNVWLGVSVEDQATADERIPILLDTPASVRWISAEPLLGALDISTWLWGVSTPCVGCPMDIDCECNWELRRDLSDDKAPGHLDWVVAGGESGPKARPSHPGWFRLLRDQCAEAGVPFLFKQWGEWYPGDIEHDGEGWAAYPDAEHDPSAEDWIFERARHDIANGAGMLRVGKKRAGRLLDGRRHDDYPSRVNS